MSNKLTGKGSVFLRVSRKNADSIETVKSNLNSFGIKVVQEGPPELKPHRF